MGLIIDHEPIDLDDMGFLSLFLQLIDQIAPQLSLDAGH